jgi:phosphatidylserine/phosphatidylglycerophosphate/cardiolipin synthase-like enzyme
LLPHGPDPASYLLRSWTEGLLKLLVQPEDGALPLVNAVRRARKSVDLMVFRFDRADLRRALADAVTRGVTVRTLIAHTNSEGSRRLRKLELDLLGAGVTVSRTADDLVRYHAKFIVIDRERAFILGFNYTSLDMLRSRSFGVEVRNRRIVQELLTLFDADATRQPYTPGLPDLLVSPLNARDGLAAFIRSARRQLLIYDPKLSDPRMIRLLLDRVRAGVDVRVLGHVAKAGASITSARLSGRRLHVRTMIADSRRAFVGSQSLKRLELDRRREVGLVIRDRKVVSQLETVFAEDWSRSAKAAASEPAAPDQVAIVSEVRELVGA